MIRLNGAGPIAVHTGYKKPEEPALLALQPSFFSMGEGDVEQIMPVVPRALEGSSFLWSSSNPEVVSVDQQGRITAKETGIAMIECEVVRDALLAKGSVSVVVA